MDHRRDDVIMVPIRLRSETDGAFLLSIKYKNKRKIIFYTLKLYEIRFIADATIWLILFYRKALAQDLQENPPDG